MASKFGKYPNYIFSTEHLPYAGSSPTNTELNWYLNDSERRFKTRPHPWLTAADVTYRFNSRGYRCCEFDVDTSDHRLIKVVSLGASEVFGCGVPEEKTFPSMFCDILQNNHNVSVRNWNLGVPGTSSDFISRTLFSALSVLRPDIVLIVFPLAPRREHFGNDDRLFSFRNVNETERYRFIKNLIDPEFARINKAYGILSSDCADQINLFNNYQLCSNLCENHNVMWLCTTFLEEGFKPLLELVNNDHLVLPGLCDLRNNCLLDNDEAGLCWARDMSHPGIKPNRLMAEHFYGRLIQLYRHKIKDF